MAWTKVTEDMLDMVPDRYRRPSFTAALLKSKYFIDKWDNFTLLALRNGNVLVTGVAKRNPRDHNNAEIALQVAWVRAYRRFVEVYETAA